MPRPPPRHPRHRVPRFVTLVLTGVAAAVMGVLAVIDLVLMLNGG